MKNLNLNECGVCEISQKEMAETNGGIIPIIICGIIITKKAAAITAACATAAAIFAAGAYVGYVEAAK